MLNSFRKGGLALATAAVCLASAAQADNHNILIVDGAYFPEILHVKADDNVYFRNNSADAHTIVSENGEWTTGELPVDSSFRVKVRDITELNFSGVGPDGEAITGYLTFELAPVDQDIDEG